MFRFLLSGWLKSQTRPSPMAPRYRRGKERLARTRFAPRLEVLEDRDVPSFVFQTIDHPNAGGSGDGTQGTFPIGINASGLISGNFGDSNDVTHGFLLSHGQYTTFNDPSAGLSSGQGTNANGLNDLGQVVGLYWDNNNVGHGFLLSQGRYTTLDDPNAPVDPNAAANTEYTVAVGINNHGQIVGYYADSNSAIRGFLLSYGQYIAVDDPHAGTGKNQGTFAIGINNQKEISGNYVDAKGVSHGFLLSDGHYTTLDDPNAAGQGTIAYGINDRGEIVGAYVDPTSSALHGFVFSHGRYTTLDDPNAATGANQVTIPLGINASGKIVGVWTDSSNLDHGFVATPANDDANACAAADLGSAGLAGNCVDATYGSSQITGGQIITAASASYPAFAVMVSSPSSSGDSQLLSSAWPEVSANALTSLDAIFAGLDDPLTQQG